MSEGICLLLGAAGVLFGLWRWWAGRRLVGRLDRMLTAAIDGGFAEEDFDESALSALESRMVRFLRGSAGANRALGRDKAAIEIMIGDISHQTKTPLSNILLYASLLEESDLPPSAAELAEAIRSQAEKLRFLVGSLVKASRLETGVLVLTPRREKVGGLLRGAADQASAAAAAKGITLTVEDTDAAAVFDPKWTAEALYNVVDNAVKYTPPGGHVVLRASALELFCRIDVVDDGPGVPEEEQGAIFSRFSRGRQVRDRDGLGIGLYLTREILGRQGGYIKLYCPPAGGSVFSLYLPREGT